MSIEVFQYIRIAHHSPGCGYVGFDLIREQGVPFEVVLPIDDAERLYEDLRRQIRNAKDHPR